MSPVCLLVAVLLVGVARGAVDQCLEHLSCQEVNDDNMMLQCLQLCQSDSTEIPLIPGEGHLQPPILSDSGSPPSPSLSASSSPQAKRSYSMEHFRWGKPVGRKRRPIKLYTSNSAEEESAEVFPAEVMRRDTEQRANTLEDQLRDVQEKKDSVYKMKHFRWSGPLPGKHHAKSRDGASQTLPLMLFSSNKDGQEGKTEQ
ncbi:pro-opiomelanocortin-like [Echeneis naucrates]|uniref:pro-opiomelanocortin-like n=1 Tax=Echeneis naucrates TaxID=173247 RepID=UPI00111362AA|nr:pro-opiomelanocortin-like [Echeneis naucrates]